MKNSSFVLRLGAALCAAVIVALIAQPIFAQKAYLKKIKELFPDLDKKEANCYLCHTFSKEKKEHAEKDNINSIGKALQSQPAMKPLLNIKDGDEHKFTDDELKIVETALKALFPDQAALEKAIKEKK